MKKKVDIINKRFGRLIVSKFLKNDEKGHDVYECLCDCGNKKIAKRRDLLSGHTKSCGCLNKEGIPNKNKIHMIGKRFGRLVVQSESIEKGKQGQVKYNCLCDCGNFVSVLGESLRSGKTSSCGCYQKEKAAESNTKHGDSSNRLYHVWQGIKNRCLNPNSSEYSNYGGRGIKICEEWLNYSNFRTFMVDIGYNFSAHRGECTIERIDVNGDYCPENCKIIPMKEQYYNRTDTRYLTYNGKTQSVTEWAKELNLKVATIYSRLDKYKWSVRKTLETPLKKSKQQ